MGRAGAAPARAMVVHGLSETEDVRAATATMASHALEELEDSNIDTDNPSAAKETGAGSARAAALCASFDRGIKVFEYAPREIKKAIVGNGAATKEQVQHMVTAILDLSVKPSEDAADAIAAALCYSNQRNLTNSLNKIKVSGR